MSTTHMSATPVLNIAGLSRKQKGLVKVLGGLSSPFHFAAVAVAEGQPMKISLTVANKMEPVAVTEGALVRGLALQSTYAEPTGAQLGQLAGYNFANDTAQALDGSPIGLLTGTGYAKTLQYEGTVLAGQQAYLSADGTKLTNVVPGVTPELKIVPIFFESAGTAGDVPVLIRFNFPLA